MVTSLRSSKQINNKQTNKQKVLFKEGARDDLYKNPLKMKRKPTWNLLLATQEEQLWVYMRSNWAGHREKRDGEKLLEQEDLIIPVALFLNKQHFQQRVLGT